MKVVFISLETTGGRAPEILQIGATCINDRKFRQLNEVSDDLYEIPLSKGTIDFDLPVQIAFFVYNYAKLRMLEFYYDFLNKYIDRRDFAFMLKFAQYFYFNY